VVAVAGKQIECTDKEQNIAGVENAHQMFGFIAPKTPLLHVPNMYKQVATGTWCLGLLLGILGIPFVNDSAAAAAAAAAAARPSR
jgi:hypothetical protein